jgi:hypothetical protein
MQNNEIKELDSEKTFVLHREMILEKSLLREIYKRTYEKIFTKINNSSGIVEIGAGAVSANDFGFNSIATDIVMNPYVKFALDAQKMNLGNNSIPGFIMINTLHHMPDCELFFREADRTLISGGKIILVEPYISLVSYFIYKFLHHEPCYSSKSWRIKNYQGGRLTDANQMIPYLVFIRDRKIFSEKFPSLEIEEVKYFNFLSYIMSGGLSHRQLIPRFLEKTIFFTDYLAEVFPKIFASSMLVVIKKS